MSLLRAGFLIGSLVAILSGCGGSAPSRGKLMAPSQLNAAAFSASGVPATFGDTDPHEWEGLMPAHYAIHGIDAARYQGLINWTTARNSGINFAWIKATEGGDHSDPGFETNAPGARAAGVPVGAYHFYYFCRTPEEQARWFIRNVKKQPGDLPPVLDIEWNHQSSCKRRPDGATVRAEMARYVSAIASHYGTRPVVYTTPDFYEQNELSRMAGVEFWLRAVTAHPSERYPGESWSFWQYSGTGVVPGVGGNVDLNAFAGTPETWRYWLAARVQR